ncbi:MAG: di-trans,poly-cis-decaprenylcistransferase, partial [Streptomycetaceae bacterium]|nr:di-trans,poly-cis-decaprenylcistransferase [Streptomycetaceae bacterium]
IAVIVDGNRRWARAHGRPIIEGHRQGAAAIHRFLEWSREIHIPYLTFWLLSIDNLNRDPRELRDLMSVIRELVDELSASGNWRLRHVGDAELLPPALAAALDRAQRATAGVDGSTVNLAVAYSGPREIVTAIRSLVDDMDFASQTETRITENDISNRLFTRGQPDPDLIIRTSGEQRLSGFMTWQAAQSEYRFVEKLWPNFSRSDFDEVIASFAATDRRGGY